MTSLSRATRSMLLLASLALGLGGLSGCGRRGPVELPPDVQERANALKAADEARAKTTRAAPKPGEAEVKRPPPPVPGTIGNRPPAQYPFVLDPLL